MAWWNRLMTRWWLLRSIMPNRGLDKSRARVLSTVLKRSDSVRRALGFGREPFSFGGVMDGPLIMACIAAGLALGCVAGFFLGGGFDT